MENFYQNSFKQLSNVQQKQVGLIVGAAVADAAARGMDSGLTAGEVAQYERDVLAFEQQHETDMQQMKLGRKPSPQQGSPNSSSSHSLQSDVTSPLVFARRTGGGGAPVEPMAGMGTTQLLVFHSFSYHLYYDLMRTMSAARGDFPMHFVGSKWVETAQAVAAASPATYTGEMGSLLHALCTLLPVPTIYPYASDNAMRGYVGEFLAALTAVPLPPDVAAQSLELPTAGGGSDGSSSGGGTLTITVAEAQAAEQALATDMALSALGIAMRFLQDNPDPERNGAFMAVPGTAALFTPDSAAFVPRGEDDGYRGIRPTVVPTAGAAAMDFCRRRAINEALLLRYTNTIRGTGATHSATAGAATAAVFPRRPVLHDAATVREGLSIVKSARSYAGGVAQAIRLGGPVCQRAMFVGALLGAKYGARQVPLPWLSATVDHQPVSTMAIEVAQWAWNPPHH